MMQKEYMQEIMVYQKRISSDRNLKELIVTANDFLLIMNQEDDALTAISATKLRQLTVYSDNTHKSKINFSSFWWLMKLRSNGVEQLLSTLQIDGVELMKIVKLIMKNKEYIKSVSKILEITEPARESETI